MADINKYASRSGRMIKEDGSIVNIADAFNDSALQVKIAGTEDTGGGSLGVNVKQSEIIQPVDVQARYAQTIQTHTAVTIAASGTSLGSYSTSWMDVSGFDKISVTSKSDAAHSYNIQISWSHDSSNQHSYEVAATGNSTYMYGEVPIRARYCRMLIANQDATNPHTLNAWVYLKA